MKAESESVFVMLWLLPRLCLWILAIWGTQKQMMILFKGKGNDLGMRKGWVLTAFCKARHAAVYGPGHAAYAARVRDCNDMNREQQTEPFVTAAPARMPFPPMGPPHMVPPPLSLHLKKKGVGFGTGCWKVRFVKLCFILGVCGIVRQVGKVSFTECVLLIDGSPQKVVCFMYTYPHLASSDGRVS